MFNNLFLKNTRFIPNKTKIINNLTSDAWEMENIAATLKLKDFIFTAYYINPKSNQRIGPPITQRVALLLPHEVFINVQ